ncbi:hypothetical protein RJP21_21675 [Paenibacillus sp. VCA1]|uniref:hypothetical protein n=1 Tax=Paenibacillus sp. VCA1 TaxID=3039148 RepID=UPI002872286D|nr:hypothetical protein [Paenibacillus sp. VCA1]MDR9856216.1 hypothetical protein [Paenibacillus sp. VCA1]
MHVTIDRTLKETWLHNIKNDYLSNFILLEDSLKNVFYYHVRSKLTDAFLNENNLRIYTELNTGYGERIDIKKRDNQCQSYLAFMHEAEYKLEEVSWLNPKQQITWAKGNLTELSGFYKKRLCYNGMNEDLNNPKVYSDNNIFALRIRSEKEILGKSIFLKL